MDFKTYQQYKETALARAAVNLPQVDASTDPVILTLAEAAAASAFSLQGAVVDLLEEAFPQTASGVFLRNAWGAYENIFPLAATPSLGYVNVNTSNTIPIGTRYTINGRNFATQDTAIDVSGFYYVKFSQTVDESTVTVTVYEDAARTTLHPHYMGTGNTISVVEDGGTHPYAGDYEISVIDATSFTFEAATTTAVTADGEYELEDSQYVKMLCETTGEATNFTVGTLSPITVGVTGNGYIAFGGLTGGADAETDENYRQRILLSRSLVEGDFTNGQIILAAFSINGNTRAFVVNPAIDGVGMPYAVGTYTAKFSGGSGGVLVKTTTPHHLPVGANITVPEGATYEGTHPVISVEDATSFTIGETYTTDDTSSYSYSDAQFEAANKDKIPVPGVVYVFILRDSDSTIIPSAAILDLTKTAIVTQGKLPSHTPPENLVVFAPTLSYLSFEITGLVPDTPTMRAAIGTQLAAFFEDNATLSGDISVDAVRAAIWDTQDLSNNERVRQFTLTQYGQRTNEVVAPDTAIAGTSTFTIGQGSIAIFDNNHPDSLSFEEA